MEKIIKIGDKDVRMRVTARVPFEFRQMFGKDIITEMQKFGTGDGAGNFETFEQLAWLLAGKPGYPEKTAQEAIGDWLEGFDGMFDIIDALPEITSFWAAGSSTQSTARKK